MKSERNPRSVLGRGGGKAEGPAELVVGQRSLERTGEVG